MYRSIALLIIAGLLFFTFSCEKNKVSDGRVTITFWHSFVSSTIPALNKLVQKFESEHPDIHIHAQYIPTGDALIQKLITSIQSKTAPDISWIHADFLENLVSADAIYKMSYFINGENGLSKEEISNIYPSLLVYSSWQDTLYSLPMEATNLGLLYNKQHFREAKLDPESPPKTWDELKSYARKLSVDKDGDGKFDQIGFFVPIYPSSGPLYPWMVWQWMPFIWQAGGYLINEEQTKVLFNMKPGIEALELWKELYSNSNMSTFTTDYDVAFAAGRLSMAMDGPWNLGRFNELLKNVDWAIAPLPAGPAKRATVAGGEYLTIFKQSKHPQEAWTFIKWLIKPEIQAFWSMNSGYLPIRRDVLQNNEYQSYLANNPNLKVYVEQMDYSQTQRSIDFYTLEITRNLAIALEKATLGNMDIKTVMDEAASESNKLLDSVKR